MASDQGESSRLQELESRTYHIDGEVSALKTQLNTQGQQLNRIEAHLLAPKPGPSYSAWAGVGISVLLGLGAMFVGISSYVDLQLQHVKGNVDSVVSSIDKLADYHDIDKGKQLDRAFELGRQTALLYDIQDKFEKQRLLLLGQDERLRVQEQESAASKVSRQAIGDYLKEVAGHVWSDRG